MLLRYRDLDHASFVEGPATSARADRLLEAAIKRAQVVVGLLHRFHLPVTGPRELGLLSAEARFLSRCDDWPTDHMKVLADSVIKQLFRSGSASRLKLGSRPHIAQDAAAVRLALLPVMQSLAESGLAGPIISNAVTPLFPGVPLEDAPRRVRRDLRRHLPAQLLEEEPEGTAILLLSASESAGELFLPPPPRTHRGRGVRRLFVGETLIIEYRRDNAPDQFDVLDACQAANWQKPIPLPAMDGSLDDVLRHLQRNSKARHSRSPVTGPAAA